MVILFVWDVWKNMMEFGRGGSCVPARVAQQGRIRRSSPAHNACIFWYGNAATRMFGRARRRRPYGFVWVLHADVAPTISNIIFYVLPYSLRIKNSEAYVYQLA